VEAPFNLIDIVFKKLQSLYFKHSLSLTPQYCVGDIIGCGGDSSCLGSLLPLSSLNTVVEAIAQPRMLVVCEQIYKRSPASLLIFVVVCLVVQAFLEVCRCCIPGLKVSSSNITSADGSTVHVSLRQSQYRKCFNSPLCFSSHHILSGH
jgi:hypothetical protein